MGIFPDCETANASLVDNRERMHGFARSQAYPIIAIAGVSSDPWLAHRLVNTAWRGGWLVLGLVLSIALYASLCKRVRAEREHAQCLEAANQAKSQFLAAASHDLRQPVQALRLYWEVLAASASDTGPRHPAFVRLGETIGVAEDLLHTLLQVSALEARVIKPRPEPTRLGQLISRALGPLHRDAEKKGLDLRVVDCSVTVDTDPTLLSQA